VQRKLRATGLDYLFLDCPLCISRFQREAIWAADLVLGPTGLSVLDLAAIASTAEMADPADVPVVAAGGIADGRGLAAALMLGAAGVLMGTRFHASEESLIAPEAKRRIVVSSGDDTVRSKIFDIVLGDRWPREYTARAIVNRFAETWRGQEAALAADAAAAAGYTQARAAGDFDTAAVYAGEGIDLVHAVEPAGQILGRVVAEAEAALTQRFVQ
jgi:nitronate monooxygenase